MVCRYQNICSEYGHNSKVFTQPRGDLANQIGNPDLIVLFTQPVSHKMAKVARKKAADSAVTLVQSHCGSGSSLRNILSGYA
jgi:hypothetical protein